MPLLEIRQASKAFPGVQALDNVSLHVDSGEVLALVGENGAGKSTLMKILAGVYTPDRGELLLDGRPVRFAGPADALRAGIHLIHQELNLAENLSAAANLFLGRELTTAGPLRWLNRRAMNERSLELLARVGLDCPPDERVDRLSPGQRQLIEIARALALNARVVIMDEPTSSLTQRETDRLFAVIRDLQRDGVAVVYISHRLAEVKELASRATVLRDGRNAGELAGGEISHDSLIRLMVGRDLKQVYPPRGAVEAPARLEVRNLTYAGGPAQPVSFALKRGEIVGLAGLMGAGRTELAEAIFGLRPIAGGEVKIDGTSVTLSNPRDAVAAGLLLVPEDRRQHGLILADSVKSNFSLPNLDTLSRLRLVARGREGRFAEELRGRLNVKTVGVSKSVGLLSGGNQQKVVLGKWLARNPRVIICDEPTRGVDVGARSEIYALLDKLAKQGAAVLMISSDLEEVLGMSDRVLVLHEGRLAGELARNELNEEAVMRLATGAGR